MKIGIGLPNPVPRIKGGCWLSGPTRGTGGILRSGDD